MNVIVWYFNEESYNQYLKKYESSSPLHKDHPNKKMISKYLYKKEYEILEVEEFSLTSKFSENFYFKTGNDFLYRTLTQANLIVSHNHTLKLIKKTGFRKNFDVFGINYNTYIANERELIFDKLLKNEL